MSPKIWMKSEFHFQFCSCSNSNNVLFNLNSEKWNRSQLKYHSVIDLHSIIDWVSVFGSVLTVVEHRTTARSTLLEIMYVTRLLNTTINAMLCQCWTIVCEVDPTLSQHWANDSCLLIAPLPMLSHLYLFPI